LSDVVKILGPVHTTVINLKNLLWLVEAPNWWWGHCAVAHPDHA